MPAKSKKTTEKICLKLYVQPGGAIIAAQEIERKDGKSIKVMYPAFVSTSSHSLGFRFDSLPYIVDEFTLYIGALMGDVELPKPMVSAYNLYVTERKKENEAMPK